MTEIAIVFTAKTVEDIFQQGGSCSWRLDRQHAKRCKYVVCTRNTKASWSEGPEAHRSAFLVGRIYDVKPAAENPDRFLFQFNDYALVTIPDFWRGDRNPVRYDNTENYPAIDFGVLDWKQMPDPKPGLIVDKQDDDVVGDDVIYHDQPLTMAQAKQGLAMTFNVPPGSIEITIRG